MVHRGVGDKAVNQLEKSVNSKLEATVARQIQSQFHTSSIIWVNRWSPELRIIIHIPRIARNEKKTAQDDVPTAPNQPLSRFKHPTHPSEILMATEINHVSGLRSEGGAN
ncbi:hypothetical protein RJ640_003464 [Escallonia rubra]|uniref:Uncharacterized protein n=1 Tax=Escallonia rubra TaxID=112253 RepID=A0AA88QTW3_9ASTE|nr:hypothetical protein RJ640_003464 [Escallonia rubra]